MAKRNYKAEYARRKANGLKKGLPLNVVRGHPRKGTLGIKAAKFIGVKPGLRVSGGPSVKRKAREPGQISSRDFDLLKKIGFIDTKAEVAKARRDLRREAARVFGVRQRDVRELLGVKGKDKDANAIAMQRDSLELLKQTEINFTSEVDFVQALVGIGFTEREAYTLWFSP